MNDPLAELALAIKISTTREEAFAAVERFLESSTARQISRQGHKQLATIIGKRIARLPSGSGYFDCGEDFRSSARLASRS
jgi:hypothetical protein